MRSDDVYRPTITLGRPESDHLSIRVLGRMHAGADDFWDGNWLVTPVEIVLGGFSGEVVAALRAEELHSFKDALEAVYASLEGEAVLESMETWLTVRVAIDRLGGLLIAGRIRDRLGSGNELTFKIDGLDQSDLPAVVEALDEVLSLFPVLGTP